MKKVATKKSAENIFFALFSISHFLKKVKSRFFPLFSIFHFFKKWKIKKSAKKIFSTDFFVATFFITAKPYLLFYGFFIMPICQFQWKWLWWTVTSILYKKCSITFFSFHWTLIIYRPTFKIQRVWRWLWFLRLDFR